jgi:uroporphyrin-III C-methyltransferase
MLARDITLAAKSTATIVILMGLTHLEKIARVFARERSPDEPMAIIQNATLPEKKIVAGTTSDIVYKAHTHQITTPAVIIIGKVVEEGNKLNSLIAHHEVINIH